MCKCYNMNLEKASVQIRSNPVTNKPYYYTYDGADGKPTVTVCLLRHDEGFARGVALRSKADKTFTETGTIKALGRAVKAAYREGQLLPIRRDRAIRILFEAGAHPFHFKSEYPVKLTTREIYELQQAR